MDPGNQVESSPELPVVPGSQEVTKQKSGGSAQWLKLAHLSDKDNHIGLQSEVYIQYMSMSSTNRNN